MPRKKPAVTEPTPPLRRSPRKRTSAATELEGDGSHIKRVKPFANSTVMTPSRSSSVVEISRPGETTGESATTVLPQRIPSPNFSGNFDIYHMKIRAFSEVYSGHDHDRNLDVELLYRTILKLQQHNGYSAQIYLAPPQQDLQATQPQLSRLRDSSFRDLVGMPYSILVRDVEHHDQITMPPMEFTLNSPDISGISAHLSLQDENDIVAGSIGALHLRRIWTKVKANGEIAELFAGHLSFKTIFYGYKDQGSGQHWNFSIWAVRARIDETGHEIGLVENIPGLSITMTSQEPAKHPKARVNPPPPSPPPPLPGTKYEDPIYVDELESDEREDEEDEDMDSEVVERFIGEAMALVAMNVVHAMNFLMPDLLQQQPTE